MHSLSAWTLEVSMHYGQDPCIVAKSRGLILPVLPWLAYRMSIVARLGCIAQAPGAAAVTCVLTWTRSSTLHTHAILAPSQSHKRTLLYRMISTIPCIYKYVSCGTCTRSTDVYGAVLISQCKQQRIISLTATGAVGQLSACAEAWRMVSSCS